MKSIFLMALCSLVALCTNAKYTQVIYLTPISGNISKNENGFFQYENEDVIVRYLFWSEKGVMGFVIYNKTDKPLYIDWSKSNFINGNQQLPYYSDRTVTNYSGSDYSSNSGWLQMFKGVAFGSSYGSGSFVSTETTTRPQRTTFISPHALISNAFSNLSGNTFYKVYPQMEEVTVDGSPMYLCTNFGHVIFRNYLTYSDNDKFTNEKHIDNAFKVSKVYTMKSSYFTYSAGNELYCDWTKPTRFYITGIKGIKNN